MYPFHPSPSTTVSLSATATTGNVKLGAPRVGQFQVRFYNAGPNTVFINRGDSTVTATTTNLPIPAGAVEVLTFSNLDLAPVTHIAGICATSQTATLYATLGEGF